VRASAPSQSRAARSANGACGSPRLYCDVMARYPLALIPVVTSSGGRALKAPDAYGSSTGTGTTAESIASWVAQGAGWIHLVDQDALDGSSATRPHVPRVSAHVQYAGGVRDDASLTAALATGADRVIVEADDLAWTTTAVAAHAGKLVVGLDIRRPDVTEVAIELQRVGCDRFLVTDEAQSHHWKHEDRHLLEEFVTRTNRPVMVRGGIHHISDLHALHDLVAHGIDGILLDDAVYGGAFTYAEAVSACADRFDMFIWGPAE